ncbi:MAG TPA: alpha/beta hydrolase [Longimicrobiaceae bacterium]|nr:alpha/beta hydrolase [Longimicrobiaceae bacterium]
MNGFLRSRAAAAVLGGALLLAAGSASGLHAQVAALAGTFAAPVADTGGYTGHFNNPDQHHADLCVRLKSPVVELRYPDGSPSGFTLTPEILQPDPGHGVWCPQAGMARLDAREIVPATDGRPMLFHRGGWGFAGNDPTSAVHYGHVLVADLDSVGLRYHRPARGESVPYAERWSPAPLVPWVDEGQRDGNGGACAQLMTVPDRVVVRSIPGDMRYLNTARTSAIPYAIYGDPSEDLGPPADRARGIRYTMLEWSWINVRGGGVARAIVEDGAEFYRCADVPPIRLASVSDAKTRTPTGWVQAVYGAVHDGKGGWLHGWIVSAHRHGDGPVVWHLREPLTMRLWPGTAPGSAPGAGPERTIQRPPDPVRGPITRVTDVSAPTLTLFQPSPEKRSGAAVLVFPGGGYQYLALDIEGTDICRWLTDAGVACGLVKYRVPQPRDSTRYLQPLQDAQRAMGLVRLHAKEWGIDPARVGVIGFSAGGNVAALISNQYAHRAYAPVDAADAGSCRPDFAMLIYPAYLVRDAHGGRLDPRVQPSSGTPPTFLVQAMDDPIGPENSLIYGLALERAGVPAELHLFAKGRHGYGMRAAAGEAAAEWPPLALRWLATVGVVPAPGG